VSGEFSICKECKNSKCGNRGNSTKCSDNSSLIRECDNFQKEEGVKMSEFKKYYEKSKIISARPYVLGEERGDNINLDDLDYLDYNEKGMIVSIFYDGHNNKEAYKYVSIDKFNETYSLCDHADALVGSARMGIYMHPKKKEKYIHMPLEELNKHYIKRSDISKQNRDKDNKISELENIIIELRNRVNEKESIFDTGKYKIKGLKDIVHRLLDLIES
jgi:hypothetical protein